MRLVQKNLVRTAWLCSVLLLAATAAAQVGRLAAKPDAVLVKRLDFGQCLAWADWVGAGAPSDAPGAGLFVTLGWQGRCHMPVVCPSDACITDANEPLPPFGNFGTKVNKERQAGAKE